MGAYYNYQFTYELVSGGSRTICLPTLGGKKFLETFYARTSNTLLLLELLKKYDEAVVNTVCDYDKKGTFIYETPNVVYDKLNKVEQAMANHLKTMNESDWLDKCLLFKGFSILCEERKEYVRLTPSLDVDWAISPVALLTRSSKEAQGGGDFDIDDLSREDGEFISSELFDSNMIGAWKDCRIRLDEYIPYGYKDITEKVFVEERI